MDIYYNRPKHLHEVTMQQALNFPKTKKRSSCQVIGCVPQSIYIVEAFKKKVYIPYIMYPTSRFKKRKKTTQITFLAHLTTPFRDCEVVIPYDIKQNSLNFLLGSWVWSGLCSGSTNEYKIYMHYENSLEGTVEDSEGSNKYWPPKTTDRLLT